MFDFLSFMAPTRAELAEDSAAIRETLRAMGDALREERLRVLELEARLTILEDRQQMSVVRTPRTRKRVKAPVAPVVPSLSPLPPA